MRFGRIPLPSQAAGGDAAPARSGRAVPGEPSLERPGRAGGPLRERGAALLVGVAGASIVVLMLLAGYALIETSGRSIAFQLRRSGQAVNVAEAGLSDALAWFQRQTTQPVTTFAPAQNLSATPPVNDTEVPSIGIVRTYPVSRLGNVWARYEVRTANVTDVSLQRGKTGAGTIWSLQSDGILFQDADNDSAFDWTDANGNGLYDRGEAGEALSVSRVKVDIQRLSLVLPGGNAAVQSSLCSGIKLNTGTTSVRIMGSSAGVGIACKSGTGTPTTTGATVLGNPASQTGVTPWNTTVANVFGVTDAELVSLADFAVPDVASLPNPLPPMSLVVIQGNATFTTSQPLLGSGILVVFGSLTIPADSNSMFSGLIYVTGAYTQRDPSMVRGAIVGQGNIQLVGGADVAEADWDALIMAQVRNALGGYRFGRTEYSTP